MTFIQSILFCTIFCFCVQAKTHILQVSNNQQVTLDISDSTMTRVFLQDDAIGQFYGDVKALNITYNEQAGFVLINPKKQGKEQYCLTLVSKKGVVVDLVLNATNGKQSFEVFCLHIKRDKKKASNKKMTLEEKANALLNGMMNNVVSSEYWKTSKSQEFFCKDANLKVKLKRRLSSDDSQLLGFVFDVSNKSKNRKKLSLGLFAKIIPNIVCMKLASQEISKITNLFVVARR